MTRKVFISYRRDDSQYPADKIYQAFRLVLPQDDVFMDVDSIPPGANFRKILKNWVDQCDVLLALIGPRWIDATDPATGKRRLDNPSDFVRIEIAEALARDIPVVPVLLDGTPMPDAASLPDDLKELPDRNGEFIVRRTFDTDVARLIRKLLPEVTAPSRAASVAPAPAPSPEARRKAEGRIRIDAPAHLLHGATDGWFKPGHGKTEWFRDHEHGPEMVVVDKGSFDMGSSPQTIAALKAQFPSAAQYLDWETPQRRALAVAGPFAVGRHAVTFAQWEAAIAGGAKLRDGTPLPKPADEGWGRGQQPVINVSWDDCVAYCAWLSKTTGKTYRLLSEVEWEYVCRTGTPTHFWWGDEISTAQANYDGNFTFGKGQTGEYRQRTLPVDYKGDKFAANPWGLWQTHGNVWEWCQDSWHDNYNGAPPDGRVWDGGNASARVVRGGSWSSDPHDLRSAYRNWVVSDDRDNDLGFRVARTF